jgi:hypothetical protein
MGNKTYLAAGSARLAMAAHPTADGEVYGRKPMSESEIRREIDRQAGLRR